MKNRIYKYFFHEFIRYFLVTLFALTAVLWTIQAVNFLDLVTEDGHAFGIYTLYSLLTIPKILTKLIPFAFLSATVLTVLKLEKDNELILLWTSGLNKINIVNLIFRISIIIMFLQIFMASIVNPTSLNLSRNLIKNSQLQFIPSLLKEKQFNDAVKGLTIFVERKDDNGNYQNVLIRDDGKVLTQISSGSSTIIAKSGYVTTDEKGLVLLDGSIQKVEKGKLNIIKFEKTTVNLSGLSTKTISQTKIQETSTLKILLCLQNFNLNLHNCNGYEKNKRDIRIEVNKRFGMAVFIPLIALIVSFLLNSRRDKKNFYYRKYIFFFYSLIIIITSEITVRYSGISLNHLIAYYFLPLLMLPVTYLILIRSFKYENLK